jgi:hypothetical protein
LTELLLASEGVVVAEIKQVVLEIKHLCGQC